MIFTMVKALSGGCSQNASKLPACPEPVLGTQGLWDFTFPIKLCFTFVNIFSLENRIAGLLLLEYFCTMKCKFIQPP
jgi:hypothetical protein